MFVAAFLLSHLKPPCWCGEAEFGGDVDTELEPYPLRLRDTH